MCKGFPIFDFGSQTEHKYIIRPKPIESLLFFGAIFNILRCIDAILLVTDAAPNAIFKSLLYELPWQFGICAFACYLFGIAHTVSNSSKFIKNNWIKITFKTDVLCSIMITLPFLTNNVCVIGASVYAERGDMAKAKIFTDILYFLWTAYCFTLALCILVAGLRLIAILKHHLKNQATLDPDNNSITGKIKNGLFKVRMIMSISITSLLIFSFIKCMYGILRVPLLKTTGLNLAIAIIWTFDGTLASILVAVVVFINPKALTSLNITSNNDSSTITKSNHYIKDDDGYSLNDIKYDEKYYRSSLSIQKI
ncbi:uncharacterized protein BX663DRAFT_527585, partial [Cokeromyces recurvatus]|uniref:uncharacterized protein n=1 Tax=Cokeromyces recurvatus TaxID=90255 RepID=UPI0022205895